MVHREFSASLPGKCDSQSLVLSAEGDKGGRSLVLLASLSDSRLFTPIAVALELCITDGPFLSSC